MISNEIYQGRNARYEKCETGWEVRFRWKAETIEIVRVDTKSAAEHLAMLWAANGEMQ